MPTLTEVADFIDKVGFPIAIVTVFVIGLGAFFWYFAPLIRKLIESHISFVDVLKVEQPKTTAVLEKQAETSERFAVSQETIVPLVKEIHREVTKPKPPRKRN